MHSGRNSKKKVGEYKGKRKKEIGVQTTGWAAVRSSAENKLSEHSNRQI